MPVYPKVSRHAMGSLWEIYLAGEEWDPLVAAGESALDEIERLDRQLSHYRDDSDIARINAFGCREWVRVEPRLYTLLKRCAELSELTGGAFDITTGPLTKAWGFYAGQGRIPTDDELESLRSQIGMHRILFDDESCMIYLAGDCMEINLGAIGKGYALDEATGILRFHGVTSALLHGGQSSIYALGAPPGEEAWELTIKDPRTGEPVREIRLREKGLATSGAYNDYFEIQGRRYGHIIDPRTLHPGEGVLSVSVIAESAADADAFSTALHLLGPEGAAEAQKRGLTLGIVTMQESESKALIVKTFGL